MSEYLFSYRHNGDPYSLEVMADSVEDAKLKVLNMSTATYEGTVVAKVPAMLGWLAKIAVAVQRFLK